jgi:hypothetical protein
MDKGQNPDKFELMKFFLKFTFDEMKAAQLALLEMERDMKKSQSDTRIPWNPEARQAQKEMRTAARSAILKISEVTGIPSELPDIDDHEPEKWLTKPS